MKIMPKVLVLQRNLRFCKFLKSRQIDANNDAKSLFLGHFFGHGAAQGRLVLFLQRQDAPDTGGRDYRLGAEEPWTERRPAT